MAKASSSRQAITANRLRDGAVVYLAVDGNWSENLAQAATAPDGDALKKLFDRAAQSARQNLIVDPVAIAVDDVDQTAPVSFREKIRLRGPSVRPDLARI